MRWSLVSLLRRTLAVIVSDFLFPFCVIGEFNFQIHHPRPPGGGNVMHMSSPACLTGSPGRPANMQHGSVTSAFILRQLVSTHTGSSPPSFITWNQLTVLMTAVVWCGGWWLYGVGLWGIVILSLSDFFFSLIIGYSSFLLLCVVESYFSTPSSGGPTGLRCRLMRGNLHSLI